MIEVETPKSYIERISSNPSVKAISPCLARFCESARRDQVWRELRQYPPGLIAVLSDGIQYVRFEEEKKVRVEASNMGWDRILAAIDISREYPQAKILTLSTSVDNITGYPDAAVYEFSIIFADEVSPESFTFIRPSSYDTFTELLEIAEETLFMGYDNIVAITNRKQQERAQVLLSTLRFAADPSERARIDRYFDLYMPGRLKTIGDPRIHKVFPKYRELVYEKLLPQVEKLRDKKFMIIASEDITGRDLRADEEHDRNLRGVQEWLEGTYGEGFINGELNSDDLITLRVVHSTDPTDIPRGPSFKAGMSSGLE